MIVETKMIGRRTPFERLPVELPDGPYTLEGLLAQLVQQEVAAYRERQNRVGLLNILTEPELTAGAAAGKVIAAPQARSGSVDVQDATRVALRAFGDGLYYVFLDDVQIESLSQPLTLRPDSTLLLLRLTALVGG
ncbi:hypothetical protein Q0M94_19565 (plasmid) [Deinococcus radiomollis]|uniref:hypothetical protein n=1 Tax=Deinococcus radiomollis TaxID=468916 RepID=UPI0038913B32